MTKIALLSTGGTIAGAGKPGMAQDYVAGKTDVKALMASLPEMPFGTLVYEELCSKDSNDITQEDWRGLLAALDKYDADPDVDGMVITHGTDTLEETAYFLSLTYRGRKPVVLTGAMRPATAASADGPMNLWQAAVLASQAESGVWCLLANTIYDARQITKRNSLKTDAFEKGEAGYMRDAHVHWTSLPAKKARFQLPRGPFPKTAVYMVHADCDPGLLGYMLEHYEGVVLAGTGAGNYPKAIQDVIQSCTGPCVIVRSSRLSEGMVFDSEIFDPEHKTVPGYDLPAWKARILLMLALMRTQNVEEVRELFARFG